MVLLGLNTRLHAQESAFWEQQWRAAAWYNTIDGPQLGVRYFGYRDVSYDRTWQVNAGLWVNTFFPDMPLAYDVRLKHPFLFPGTSPDYIALVLKSAFRDGHLRHSAGFTSRLATGNGPDQLLRFYANVYRYEQRDSDYLVFKQSWSQQDHFLAETGAYLRQTWLGGYQSVHIQALLGTGATANTLRASGTAQHAIGTRFRIGTRLGSVVQTSRDVRAEFDTNLSYASAWEWYESPFFRSHGQLPVAWVRQGNAVQSSVFVGVRGYANHDTRRFRQGQTSAIQQYYTGNLVLEWVNPIGRTLSKIPIAGPFLHLNTYAFADAGYIVYFNAASVRPETIASAGPGIQLRVNIPDYWSADRGFALRWDLPLWISSPAPGTSPFQFRQQLSFDIIIPF